MNTKYKGADLRQANFSDKYLVDMDFSDADLSGAKFASSSIHNCRFNNANLEGADFSYCKIWTADFTEANLKGADLSYTWLVGDILAYGVNLTGANVGDVIFRTTVHTDIKIQYQLACPESGSFVGYKVASHNRLVTLEIPAHAKRSSAFSKKCRCSEAKVLSIVSIDSGEEFDVAYSIYDWNFEYKVGEVVKVDDFDENRWRECAPGIHFFMTKEDAINYCL